MAAKKDTTSKTKLAARATTQQLDAEAKALAGDALNADTYRLVMEQRDVQKVGGLSVLDRIAR